MDPFEWPPFFANQHWLGIGCPKIGIRARHRNSCSQEPEPEPQPELAAVRSLLFYPETESESKSIKCTNF